jgi:hypothetical protein
MAGLGQRTLLVDIVPVVSVCFVMSWDRPLFIPSLVNWRPFLWRCSMWASISLTRLSYSCKGVAPLFIRPFSRANMILCVPTAEKQWVYDGFLNLRRLHHVLNLTVVNSS